VLVTVSATRQTEYRAAQVAGDRRGSAIRGRTVWLTGLSGAGGSRRWPCWRAEATRKGHPDLRSRRRQPAAGPPHGSLGLFPGPTGGGSPHAPLGTWRPAARPTTPNSAGAAIRPLKRRTRERPEKFTQRRILNFFEVPVLRLRRCRVRASVEPRGSYAKGACG